MAWAYAIRSVSEPIMKFGLNAVTDTLPHFSNLKKWKKVDCYNFPEHVCEDLRPDIVILSDSKEDLRS